MAFDVYDTVDLPYVSRDVVCDPRTCIGTCAIRSDPDSTRSEVASGCVKERECFHLRINLHAPHSSACDTPTVLTTSLSTTAADGADPPR